MTKKTHNFVGENTYKTCREVRLKKNPSGNCWNWFSPRCLQAKKIKNQISSLPPIREEFSPKNWSVSGQILAWSSEKIPEERMGVVSIISSEVLQSQWKPFWLVTPPLSTKWLAVWQFHVHYNVYAQVQYRIVIDYVEKREGKFNEERWQSRGPKVCFCFITRTCHCYMYMLIFSLMHENSSSWLKSSFYFVWKTPD